MKNKIKFTLENEFDALIIALISTLLFYGSLWLVFNYLINNSTHRLFILLGGNFPTGIIQFFTFLAFFWGMIILNSKIIKVNWEKKALKLDLLPKDPHKVLLPEEINDLRLSISNMIEWKESIYLKQIESICTKFRANKSAQETLDILKARSEINLYYLESTFSIIKYLAWSIPSIGFVGTVLGISGALQKTHEAVTGDISGITNMLGTAFDTTLVALFLSIILMFQIHRVQKIEESFILLIQEDLLENLINRIYVPKKNR